MARRPRKVSLAPIAHYEAQDAANTIARARQHLANPHMVKAIKAHVSALNDAVSGGLRPKKPTMRGGMKTRPPKMPTGGL